MRGGEAGGCGRTKMETERERGREREREREREEDGDGELEREGLSLTVEGMLETSWGKERMESCSLNSLVGGPGEQHSSLLLPPSR